MNSKIKNKVEEPAAVYESTPKNEVVVEESHPVLLQLIKKSIKNHDEGKVFTHEEAMKIYNEKIASKR